MAQHHGDHVPHNAAVHEPCRPGRLAVSTAVGEWAAHVCAACGASGGQRWVQNASFPSGCLQPRDATSQPESGRSL